MHEHQLGDESQGPLKHTGILWNSMDKPKAGAVLFAKDHANLARFYTEAMRLTPVSRDADHIVLACEGFRLVVHQIPSAIADEIKIDTPPRRRESGAIKVVLEDWTFHAPTLVEGTAELAAGFVAFELEYFDVTSNAWSRCEVLSPVPRRKERPCPTTSCSSARETPRAA